MWEKRAARARLLAGRHASTRDILLFYAGVAEWQSRMAGQEPSFEKLVDYLPSLLDLIARTAPPALLQSARELDPSRGRQLIEEYWTRESDAFSSLDFFPRALLQPYASSLPCEQPCPWCRKPPQVGALRPMGEGLALDAVCALCIRGRPLARGRCPGCNESVETRLSVYSTPDFSHLRLQACETCHAYLPLVDLSRDPQAIPEVDELAGLPLDLWALEHGYHKLQPNLAGI